MGSQRYKFMNIKDSDILKLSKDEIGLGNMIQSVDTPTSDSGIILDSNTTGFYNGRMNIGIQHIDQSGRIHLNVNVLDFNSMTVGSTFNFGKYQVESEDPWAIEWEIVHQTDEYQIAQTKQIIDCRSFDAKEPNNTDSDRKNYGNNNWQYSNIKQFLNSDKENWYSAQHSYDAPPNSDNVYDGINPYDTHKGFLYYFSDEEKNLLKDMTFDLYNPTVDGGGSYTWTGKVWLPTYTQMGYGNNNSISEGFKFDKYSDNNSRIKTINKYCAENNPYCISQSYSEGRAWHYWCSSAYASNSSNVWFAHSTGDGSSSYSCYGICGFAPCICLPRTIGGGVINDTISFYIDDTLYKSPRGYTFSQWVNTSYNYNGWYNDGTNIINYNTNTHISDITSSSTIEDGKKYSTISGSSLLIDFSTMSLGSTFNFGKYQVENETPWAIEWEIVHQTDEYQIAQTKQIIDLRAFDAIESNNTDSNRKNYGNNNWQYSNIKQFLNSDKENWYSAQHQYAAPPISSNVSINPYDTHKGFLYYFSDEEKSLLKDMTLTLANPTVDGGGSYTWTGKVWLPTITQMGYGDNESISEGTKFDKYSDNNSRIKTVNKYCGENNPYCIRNGYSEGTEWWYWCSSVRVSESCYVWSASSAGNSDRDRSYDGGNGLAPCIKISKSGGFWV